LKACYIIAQNLNKNIKWEYLYFISKTIFAKN
jgi:hypothetical protein